MAVLTLMPVTTTRLFIDEHLGDGERGQRVAVPRLSERDNV